MKSKENLIKKKLKWFSETTYVDKDTGEIISKSVFQREYIKQHTVTKTELHENYGIIRHTTVASKNRQTKLIL